MKRKAEKNAAIHRTLCMAAFFSAFLRKRIGNFPWYVGRKKEPVTEVCKLLLRPLLGIWQKNAAKHFLYFKAI